MHISRTLLINAIITHSKVYFSNQWPFYLYSLISRVSFSMFPSKQPVCFEEKPNHNAVSGLVTASNNEEGNTIFLGNTTGNTEECKELCGEDLTCVAYAQHLMSFSQSHWKGRLNLFSFKSISEFPYFVKLFESSKRVYG